MNKNPNDNHFENFVQKILFLADSWEILVFFFILNIILYIDFIFNVKKGVFTPFFKKNNKNKKWHHTLILHLVLLGFPPDTIRYINCNVNYIIHYSSLLESKKSMSSTSPGVNSFTWGKSLSDSNPNRS